MENPALLCLVPNAEGSETGIALEPARLESVVPPPLRPWGFRFESATLWVRDRAPEMDLKVA